MLLPIAPLISLCIHTAVAMPDIATVRQLAPGTVVPEIAGRISAAGVFRNTAYLQDATGGIALYDSLIACTVHIGDSVVIRGGIVAEHGASGAAAGSGTMQLEGNPACIVVDTGHAPSPIPVPLLELSEHVEGMLVRTNGVAFVQGGRFQGETTYAVSDADGHSAEVWIDACTDLARTNATMPRERGSITGIVAQYRGTYQLMPRTAADIGIMVDEHPADKASTLDITTWNVQWFGTSDTLLGPADKKRQRLGVHRVLDSVRSDIFVLQEISSEAALREMSDGLGPHYQAIIGNGSTGTGQSVAFLYDDRTVRPISYGVVRTGTWYDWSNGRYPLRMSFLYTHGDDTVPFCLFGIHAKATASGTEQRDYERRAGAAQSLYDMLRQSYADSSTIVVGDFNDGLARDSADPYPGPYQCYIEDTASWWSPTLGMERSGMYSYIHRRSFIDHVLMSRHMKPWLAGSYVESPQAYTTSYAYTVSDHLPVTIRLAVGGPSSHVESYATASLPHVQVRPNPILVQGTVEVRVASGTEVSMDLVDAMGRIRLTLWEGVSPTETLRVDLPVESLASGIYYVVVRCGMGQVSAPVGIIVH